MISKSEPAGIADRSPAPFRRVGRRTGTRVVLDDRDVDERHRTLREEPAAEAVGVVVAQRRIHQRDRLAVARADPDAATPAPGRARFGSVGDDQRVADLKLSVGPDPPPTAAKLPETSLSEISSAPAESIRIPPPSSFGPAPFEIRTRAHLDLAVARDLEYAARRLHDAPDRRKACSGAADPHVSHDPHSDRGSGDRRLSGTSTSGSWPWRIASRKEQSARGSAPQLRSSLIRGRVRRPARRPPTEGRTPAVRRPPRRESRPGLRSDGAGLR